MEKSEQRFVIKFLFLESLDSKEIHSELTAVLGSTVYLLHKIKEWRRRFAKGNLSCQDQIRPGRRPHVLGKALSDFLEKFPFASADIIAQDFGQSKHTFKQILKRELGPGYSLEDWPHIRSQSLEKLMDKPWQSTCSASSLNKCRFPFHEL
jgi:hypothetical protein